MTSSNPGFYPEICLSNQDREQRDNRAWWLGTHGEGSRGQWECSGLTQSLDGLICKQLVSGCLGWSIPPQTRPTLLQGPRVLVTLRSGSTSWTCVSSGGSGGVHKQPGTARVGGAHTAARLGCAGPARGVGTGGRPSPTRPRAAPACEGCSWLGHHHHQALAQAVAGPRPVCVPPPPGSRRGTQTEL